MKGITEPRLIFFGGKGGVGKTICSAAAGVHLARLGRKTLVYSADPAHSLSDCFSREIGNKTTRITDNLYALEIDAKALLDELKRSYLEEVNEAFRSLVRGIDLPFERDLLRNLFELSPPGLDELMALTKLTEIERDEDYDSIVVDMAAGAHTVRLLELPKPFEDWMNTLLGFFNQQAYLVPLERTRSFLEDLKGRVASLGKELSDPKKALFIPVLTPESLAISVTDSIIKAVKSSHISVDRVIANQLIPKEVGCPFCESLRKEQAKRLAEMSRKFGEVHVVKVLMLPEPVRGLKSLETFAEIVFEGKRPGPVKERGKTPKRKTRLTTVPGKSKKKLLVPDDIRLLLFGGKGGCGKTTCSAAIGLLMASQGKKTLIFSTDPQRSLSEAFQQPIGEKTRAIEGAENLWALQISAEKLLSSFKEKHREEISEIVTSATYLSEVEVLRFLDLSLPGMDEVMGLLKLIEIIEEKRYDLVVLDTAPTGHTMRFLEMPALLSAWANLLVTMRSKSQFIAQTFFGRPLQTKADAFLAKLLNDIEKINLLLKGKETTFVPVTVPEAMAIVETERFVSFLENYGMSVEAIIVNKLMPPGIECNYCATRSEGQLLALRQLNPRLSAKAVKAQLFPYEIVGLQRLKEFGTTLAG